MTSSYHGQMSPWLPLNSVFYGNYLCSKVIFYWRLPSIKGLFQFKFHFPLKVAFLYGCLAWELSSIGEYFLSMVALHQRFFLIKGCPPSKVLINQRLYSIKGCLPGLVVFHPVEDNTPGLELTLSQSNHMSWTWID